MTSGRVRRPDFCPTGIIHKNKLAIIPVRLPRVKYHQMSVSSHVPNLFQQRFYLPKDIKLWTFAQFLKPYNLLHVLYKKNMNSYLFIL
jgi:hypothetical protein